MPRLSRPACSCLTDQFDAGNIECFNQCHERVDIPADHAVARFYPLNGPAKKSGPSTVSRWLIPRKAREARELRSCYDRSF